MKETSGESKSEDDDRRLLRQMKEPARGRKLLCRG